MKCIYRRQSICIYTSLSSIGAYRHCVRGFGGQFRHARVPHHPLADRRTDAPWMVPGTEFPAVPTCTASYSIRVSGPLPYRWPAWNYSDRRSALVDEARALYCEYPTTPGSMDRHKLLIGRTEDSHLKLTHFSHWKLTHHVSSVILVAIIFHSMHRDFT